MVKLIFHGRRTAAHQKLIDGQTPDGARVVRRAKGFSDHGVINGLVRAGWSRARAGRAAARAGSRRRRARRRCQHDYDRSS